MTAVAAPRALLGLYRGLLAAEVQATAAYRTQILLSGLDWVVPLAFLALWRAASTTGIAGITPDQFTTYFCVLLITGPVQLSFHLSFAFQPLVHSGRLSVLLLRPRHPAHGLVADGVATRLFRVAPLVLVVPLLVTVLGGTTTRDPLQWLLAVVIGAIGWLCEVYLGLMMGCLALWSTRSDGIRGLLYGSEWLLGGLIAPIPLLPGVFPELLRHQPMWFAIGAPAEVIAGISRLSVWSLVEGAAWVVVLHLLFGLVWRRGMLRYEAVGT